MFGKPTRAPQPEPSAPAARTGTDDAPAMFGDYLAQMQKRQLEERGWTAPETD
jgi:hypothetical protein